MNTVKNIEQLIDYVSSMDKVSSALSLESLVDVSPEEKLRFRDVIEAIMAIGIINISDEHKKELYNKIDKAFNLHSDEIVLSNEFKILNKLINI